MEAEGVGGRRSAEVEGSKRQGNDKRARSGEIRGNFKGQSEARTDALVKRDKSKQEIDRM